MNILSLFDGISCGRVALERAGIYVSNYYTSEIDTYASAIARYNYPDNIELGDVTKWRDWDIDWSSIDLLFAGFPCQAWSLIGNQEGINDSRGELIYSLMEIWNNIMLYNPKIKVLFENVKMKKEYLCFVNDLIGIQPATINSSLFSAQNRERLYWTNIVNITLPKNICTDVVIDILENNALFKAPIGYLNNLWSGKKRLNKVNSCNGKSACLLASTYKKNTSAYCKNTNNEVHVYTPVECCRLQTLSDDYTAYGIKNNKKVKISPTQQYKAIGNGWTVDVISHILSGLKQTTEVYKTQRMLF